MACNGNNRVVFRYMIDKRLRFIEKTENPLSKNIEMRIGIHTEVFRLTPLRHRWSLSLLRAMIIFASFAPSDF